MAGIIIEGVCASGKSTIMKRLTRRDWYVEKQNKIQFGEYLTERIVENIGPSVDNRVELLEEYVDMLEKVYFNFYNSRFANTKSERVKPFFLLERFHITHGVESKDFNPFIDIDNRLAAMDMKLILLVMDDNVIEKRLLDTFPRRPKTWEKYCLSFGGIEGATERYRNMQELLLSFTKVTKLDTIILNTSREEWDVYIDIIESFIGI